MNEKSYATPDVAGMAFGAGAVGLGWGCAHAATRLVSQMSQAGVADVSPPVAGSMFGCGRGHGDKMRVLVCSAARLGTNQMSCGDPLGKIPAWRPATHSGPRSRDDGRGCFRRRYSSARPPQLAALLIETRHHMVVGLLPFLLVVFVGDVLAILDLVGYVAEQPRRVALHHGGGGAV